MNATSFDTITRLLCLTERELDQHIGTTEELITNLQQLLQALVHIRAERFHSNYNDQPQQQGDTNQ